MEPAPAEPAWPEGAAGTIERMKDQEERLKQQLSDSQHRERILMRRLAAKEQEVQDYVAQIGELKSAQLSSAGVIGNARNCVLDPAVNVLVMHLKQELVTTKNRLEETQSEFSAWKFTADSNTGKKLMAKCRLLYQENEDLGKMTTSGRIAKLEGDLALQKRFSEEVKKSQSELNDLLQELDEDVEGMQSTIYILQQELRAATDQNLVLTKENQSLRARLAPDTRHPTLTNGANPDEYDSEPDLIIKVSDRDRLCDDEDSRDSSKKRKLIASDNDKCYGLNGLDDNKSDGRTNCETGNEKKHCYESDSSECSSGGHNKKQRRASVLSLDYQEEEDALTTHNGDAD